MVPKGGKQSKQRCSSTWLIDWSVDWLNDWLISRRGGNAFLLTSFPVSLPMGRITGPGGISEIPKFPTRRERSAAPLAADLSAEKQLTQIWSSYAATWLVELNKVNLHTKLSLFRGSLGSSPITDLPHGSSVPPTLQKISLSVCSLAERETTRILCRLWHLCIGQRWTSTASN